MGQSRFAMLNPSGFGRTEQMRTRGQTVRLKNKGTGREVRLLVILSDSKQGYLASDSLSKVKEGNWAWYNLNEWSEVK